MQTLRVIVYLNDVSKADNKRLFERLVPIVTGVKLDFECLLTSMRVLFGNSCIVVFELS